MSSINTTTSMRQRTSSILFIICAFMFMFLPSAGQVSYVRTYTPRTVMTPAEVRESNSCVSIVFYDGQLVELRTDGGWFSMWNDTLSTMHGWDMYDSKARLQYALLPLTQREKMQNFPLNKIQLILADYYRWYQILKYSLKERKNDSRL